jgi:hypothetical protein
MGIKNSEIKAHTEATRTTEKSYLLKRRQQILLLVLRS